ncbi:hypothetical protein NPIL_650051 [Nephila pilipes]|uniref:Uncharacterized protein n=1 Tax=Nephila pilipes TaxID=299642 RepID=A0A8X6P3L8_NEPPI|nr:hypothetical protein NPIL_650051 [Nephila pilipes]
MSKRVPLNGQPCLISHLMGMEGVFLEEDKMDEEESRIASEHFYEEGILLRQREREIQTFGLRVFRKGQFRDIVCKRFGPDRELCFRRILSIPKKDLLKFLQQQEEVLVEKENQALSHH